MNQAQPVPNNNAVILIAVAIALLLLTKQEGCVGPVGPAPSAIDRVTYVYEKDDTVVPKLVAFALQKLNEDATKGIIASEFEKDTVNGNGQIPEQYKIALEAAKGAGLPALVVQVGEKVVKIVKNPSTEEHVAEALK